MQSHKCLSPSCGVAVLGALVSCPDPALYSWVTIERFLGCAESSFTWLWCNHCARGSDSVMSTRRTRSCLTTDCIIASGISREKSNPEIWLAYPKSRLLTQHNQEIVGRGWGLGTSYALRDSGKSHVIPRVGLTLLDWSLISTWDLIINESAHTVDFHNYVSPFWSFWSGWWCSQIILGIRIRREGLAQTTWREL